jgi:hypothetical protein
MRLTLAKLAIVEGVHAVVALAQRRYADAAVHVWWAQLLTELASDAPLRRARSDPGQ